MSSILALLIQAVIESALTIVFGWYVCIYLVWAWARGRLKRSVKREAPPSCLGDPTLGRHQFVRVNNVKLHYVESGSHERPLLILIHGAPDFWFTWRKQIPDFANSYWVVAVDLRGCGDSEKLAFRNQYTTDILVEDMAAIIKALGRDSAHVACCGLSGQVGWSLAYKYPHMVNKLVLFHAPHPYIIRQHFHSSLMHYIKGWYYLFVRLPILPELAASLNDGSLIDSLLKPLAREKAVTKEEIEAYKFNFTTYSEWSGSLQHLRQISLAPVWETEPPPKVLTTPTLLIMGDPDALTPIDLAYKSAEYVERITIKPLSGPPRLVHQSQPTQVNQVVLEFLREMPWKPLTPATSSLMGRVMGAGMAAVNKTSEAWQMTQNVGLMEMAKTSLNIAEAKLGLDQY